MRLLPLVNSFWRVPIILFMTMVLSTISVLFSLIDSSGKLQHECARTWGRFILWISRVRVLTFGTDRLDRQRGYIFMPNHLSMFDHWSLLAHLPVQQFGFAAKASLFAIPFLGWHLTRSGNVPVNRWKPRQTVKRFRQVGERIEEGWSLVIYPEGERTVGDRFARFKRGAFLLARNARAPIVPITIIGAHRRLPRGSAFIRPGSMELVFHPVLEFADYEHLDLQQISDRVQHMIEESYRQVEES